MGRSSLRKWRKLKWKIEIATAAPETLQNGITTEHNARRTKMQFWEIDGEEMGNATGNGNARFEPAIGQTELNSGELSFNANLDDMEAAASLEIAHCDGEGEKEATGGPVQGSFHQANIPGVNLNAASRGHQCTGIVALALAASSLGAVEEWRTEHLDRLLELGHAHAVTIWNQRGEGLTCPELPPANVVGSINVDGDIVSLALEPDDYEYDGTMYETVHLGLNPVNLISSLQKFINSGTRTAFFITGRFTMGLIISQDQSKVYFFDSHARNKDGLGCVDSNDKGAACLIPFDSKTAAVSIANHIEKLFPMVTTAGGKVKEPYSLNLVNGTVKPTNVKPVESCEKMDTTTPSSTLLPVAKSSSLFNVGDKRPSVESFGAQPPKKADVQAKASKFKFTLNVYPPVDRTFFKDHPGTSNAEYEEDVAAWEAKTMKELLNKFVLVPNWHGVYGIHRWNGEKIEASDIVNATCNLRTGDGMNDKFVLIHGFNYGTQQPLPGEPATQFTSRTKPVSLWANTEVIQVLLQTEDQHSNLHKPLQPRHVAVLKQCMKYWIKELDGRLEFKVITRAAALVKNQHYIHVVGTDENSNSNVGRVIGDFNLIQVRLDQSDNNIRRSFHHEFIHTLGGDHSHQFPFSQRFLRTAFAKAKKFKGQEDLHDYAIIKREAFWLPEKIRLCECSIMIYGPKQHGKLIFTWLYNDGFKHFGHKYEPCQHDIQNVKFLYPLREVVVRNPDVRRGDHHHGSFLFV